MGSQLQSKAALQFQTYITSTKYNNMNQNQSPPLPEEKKLSKLGFNLNLLKFTKSLAFFGMFLIPVMICASLSSCLKAIRYEEYRHFAPGAELFLISVLFIVMIVFLKKRIESKDIIEIEKIAVIANYFLKASEVIVPVTILVCSMISQIPSSSEIPFSPYDQEKFTVTKFLDDNLKGLFCVFTVTAMAALSIHAVRTNNNSLLESYIFARYIIVFIIITTPGIMFLSWNYNNNNYELRYGVFYWLALNGGMIFNLGITLILQGIRNKDEEDSKK